MPVLPLLFAVAVIEIALFIWIGGVIGVLATLSWVVGAVFLGLFLLRSLGTSLGNTIQSAMTTSGSPGTALAESGLLALAAILFVVPGFLSDAVAVILLPQPFRRFLVGRLTGRSSILRRPGPASSQILEAEYEIIAAPDNPPHELAAPRRSDGAD